MPCSRQIALALLVMIATGTIVAAAPEAPLLAFEIRAAPDVGALADRAWQPLLDKHRALAPGDRCLQYRATFFSDNGERYPVLDRVTIDLDPVS